MATPYLSDPDVTLYLGDAVEVLRDLPDRSVHAALCSPPFYGLRDYGVSGQIGLEQTPEEWAASLVAVFDEVRRVLRDDGTLWVECGDSYAANGTQKWGGNVNESREAGVHNGFKVTPTSLSQRRSRIENRRPDDVKAKDLIGQPFLLAFALREAGWYWRGMYVWEKPDAMPESAQDRCTTSHSYVMHFSKKPRYYHDADAIREKFSAASANGSGNTARRLGADYGRPGSHRGAGVPWAPPSEPTAQLNLDGQETQPERRAADGRKKLVHDHNVYTSHDNYSNMGTDQERWPNPEGRNARSVWRINTESTSFGLCPVCRAYWDSGAPAKHCGTDVVAHFATWPHELAGKIIACATSAAGVCEECGAPRQRVTERTRTMNGEPIEAGSWPLDNAGRLGAQGVGHWRFATRSETLGWQPTCDHDAPTVPATVLDPFAGSATTGRQARAMGRRSILIELSPDYAEIAANRLQQLAIFA